MHAGSLSTQQNSCESKSRQSYIARLLSQKTHICTLSARGGTCFMLSLADQPGVVVLGVNVSRANDGDWEEPRGFCKMG